MTNFLSTIADGATDLFHFTLGSRKAVEYAEVAAYLLANPTKLTFKIFFHMILDSLHARPEMPSKTFTEDELKEFLDYAILSKEVYNEATNRKIPKELSNIVYEDANSRIDKTPYFIVNSEERNKIILAIRGTYTFADFFTDCKANSANIDGILMHYGVYKAANAVFVRSSEYLESLSREHNREIVITGHSLGASVAAVVAILMKKQYPNLNVRAVCFAPVACVSSEIINESYDYITSFVVGNDPVPFLSLHNTAQVPETELPEFLRKFVEECITRDISDPLPLPDDLDLFLNPFEESPPPIEKIKEDLKINSRRTTALYPPGKVYRFILSGSTFKKVSVEYITDNIEYFGVYRKGINEEDHAILIYHDSICELLEKLGENK